MQPYSEAGEVDVRRTTGISGRPRVAKIPQALGIQAISLDQTYMAW